MLSEMRYIETELLPMLRERRRHQADAASRQLSFWAGKSAEPPLLLSIADELPEQRRLPLYDLAEIHCDSEKMFVRGLREALAVALADGDGVPSMRANMGCGIFATMFGLKQTVFPDKMPWLTEHLTKKQLLVMMPGDLVQTAEYKNGLEHMRLMKQLLEGTGVEVYPMDLQGPVDLAHLVYGDAFFYDLYDDPEFISHLLQLATACIIRGMCDCLEILRPVDFVAHYNGLVLPAAQPCKISEDTSTLLNKQHINEYSAPCVNQVLAHFGGGYIHYCGRNPHLLEATRHIGPALALNLGNPEMHDMNAVLAGLARDGRVYYGRTDEEHLSAWVHSATCNGRVHLVAEVACEKGRQQAVAEHHRASVRQALKGRAGAAPRGQVARHPAQAPQSRKAGMPP